MIQFYNNLRSINFYFYIVNLPILVINFLSCSKKQHEFDGQWKVIHYGSFSTPDKDKEVSELVTCENTQIEIYKSNIYGDCECMFFANFSMLDSLNYKGCNEDRKIFDKSIELNKQLRKQISNFNENSFEWYSTRAIIDLTEMNYGYLIKIKPKMICLVVNENFLVLKKVE